MPRLSPHPFVRNVTLKGYERSIGIEVRLPVFAVLLERSPLPNLTASPAGYAFVRVGKDGKTESGCVERSVVPAELYALSLQVEQKSKIQLKSSSKIVSFLQSLSTVRMMGSPSQTEAEPGLAVILTTGLSMTAKCKRIILSQSFEANPGKVSR